VDSQVDRHGDSLIAQDAEQLRLIDDSSLVQHVVDEEQSTGTYTGARFFSRDPERYKLVVALLANGYGRLRIAEMLHVNHHTVAAVLARESESIAIEKQRLAGLARYGAGLCLEGVIEDLEDPERRKKIGTRDKAISGGVLIDKMQLLSGHATAIIDHHHSAPGHDDFIDSLQRVHDQGAAGTGFGAETDGQKALGDGAAAGHLIPAADDAVSAPLAPRAPGNTKDDHSDD